MSVSDIPKSHPRYHSLMLRHRLTDGLKAGLTSEAGLIAHGRGETFDYLIGEKTLPFAQEAIEAAASLLVTARQPVLSVNGNTAALAVDEVVELQKSFDRLVLEVNLFHHSDERSRRIAEHLRSHGALRVTESSVDPVAILPGVESARRKMAAGGLAEADVVLVALEDGDRCKALVDAGRTVIAIDLNPMSRTARYAHVTIVDELTRAVPAIRAAVVRDLRADPGALAARVKAYDNARILEDATRAIRRGAI